VTGIKVGTATWSPYLPHAEIIPSSGDFPMLLTADQAAALLGVSPSTLYRWAARRIADESVGPPVILLGEKILRWDACELRKWLAEQER